MKGSAIGSVIDQNCRHLRGAVDLGRLVDVSGSSAARPADQHDVGRPHPDVDDDDRQGASATSPIIWNDGRVAPVKNATT